MKRVFCFIAVVAAAVTLLVLMRDIRNYTRIARVCQDSSCEQFLVDRHGEIWLVQDELPLGAEVELTIREGGVLGEFFDDTILSVEVLYAPAENAPVLETVVAPLNE